MIVTWRSTKIAEREPDMVRSSGRRYGYFVEEVVNHGAELDPEYIEAVFSLFLLQGHRNDGDSTVVQLAAQYGRSPGSVSHLTGQFWFLQTDGEHGIPVSCPAVRERWARWVR